MGTKDVATLISWRGRGLALLPPYSLTYTFVLSVHWDRKENTQKAAKERNGGRLVMHTHQLNIVMIATDVHISTSVPRHFTTIALQVRQTFRRPTFGKAIFTLLQCNLLWRVVQRTGSCDFDLRCWYWKMTDECAITQVETSEKIELKKCHGSYTRR